MPRGFECAYCEHQYPVEYRQEWGRGHGDGYGPVAVCTQIVTDPRTGAGAVCRGPLVVVASLEAIVEEVENGENGAEGGDDSG